MTDTPPNPDALAQAKAAAVDCRINGGSTEDVAECAVEAYLAVAQPELQANSKPKQNLEFVNILEILEAHQRSFRNGRCSCEEYGTKRTGKEHHAHVAEVLEKHMQEREAEAWDEGAEAEAAAACMNPPCGSCDGCFTPVDNPYKESE